MKWDANLYDQKHQFVSQYGAELVQLLHPLPGESILDAGCGTGDLSAQIAEAGSLVEGIDLSESMIQQAREKYPHIHFEVGSVTEFEKSNYYDAIFSNATLHWVLDKEAAIRQMYKNLKFGGRLVLEMGGKGNVQRIITALQQALSWHNLADRADTQQWYFPSIGAYCSLLDAVGFDVEYAVHFSRPTELASSETGIKDWIRMFGKSFLEGLDAPTIELVLEDVQQALQKTQFINNKWYADYKRLRIIAKKSMDS